MRSTSSPVPTGTVDFTSDGVDIGNVAVDKTGTATFAISTLAIGQHTIVATYQGTSAAVSVLEGTVTVTGGPGAATAPVAVTAGQAVIAARDEQPVTISLSDLAAGHPNHRLQRHAGR